MSGHGRILGFSPGGAGYTESETWQASQSTREAKAQCRAQLVNNGDPPRTPGQRFRRDESVNHFLDFCFFLSRSCRAEDDDFHPFLPLFLGKRGPFSAAYATNRGIRRQVYSALETAEPKSCHLLREQYFREEEEYKEEPKSLFRTLLMSTNAISVHHDHAHHDDAEQASCEADFQTEFQKTENLLNAFFLDESVTTLRYIIVTGLIRYASRRIRSYFGPFSPTRWTQLKGAKCVLYCKLKFSLI